MIINHNMMAQNSHRIMGINASTMGKSTEKLSSGMRVNRAADDAAGLSISEKMRGQIRGLTQASRNAQDAISVVQTAEGALDETHSIIQRMRELAVQSSNDSNVNIDRAAIQQEVNQLTSELDRISTATQFNTMNLLDGTFKNKVFHVGANSDQNIGVTIDAMSAQGLGLRMTANAANKVTAEATASLSKKSDSLTTLKTSAAKIGSTAKVKADSVSKKQASVSALQASAGNLLAQGKEASAAAMQGKADKANASLTTLKSSLKVINEQKASVLHTADAAQKYIDSLNAKIEANGGVLVNSQETANKAITVINDALTKVSRQRSDLGAIQNRLEHTIKNLDNAAENTQAAESRIRDTDMAKEMSEFTKKNILTQASQAMLAQANQLPQQVLQLLR